MTRSDLHRIRRPIYDSTTYKRPMLDATGARLRKADASLRPLHVEMTRSLPAPPVNYRSVTVAWA